MAIRRPSKHRFEGLDIRDVLAAAVGVVGHDPIAVPPTLKRNGARENVAQAGGHGVEMDRHAGRLRHAMTVGVEHIE